VTGPISQEKGVTHLGAAAWCLHLFSWIHWELYIGSGAQSKPTYGPVRNFAKL